MNRRTRLVAGLAGILLLGGCSQVSALAPVGGDRPTKVRFATIEVLLDHGTELMAVPTCEMADDRSVSCSGTTIDGDAISALSPAHDQGALEVRVGDDLLYEGTIDAVIETSIRP